MPQTAAQQVPLSLGKGNHKWIGRTRSSMGKGQTKSSPPVTRLQSAHDFPDQASLRCFLALSPSVSTWTVLSQPSLTHNILLFLYGPVQMTLLWPSHPDPGFPRNSTSHIPFFQYLSLNHDCSFIILLCPLNICGLIFLLLAPGSVWALNECLVKKWKN